MASKAIQFSKVPILQTKEQDTDVRIYNLKQERIDRISRFLADCDEDFVSRLLHRLQRHQQFLQR